MTTITTTTMLQAFVRNHPDDVFFTSVAGVILFNGVRYYTLADEYRRKTRGSINLYRYDAKNGLVIFRKHNDQQEQVYDQMSMVKGAGDVWFSDDFEPKLFGPPNLLSARKNPYQTTVKEWWAAGQMYGGIPDNIVWDMNLVLMTRGREGGGRGKTFREPTVKYGFVEGGYGIPDIEYMHVETTNHHADIRTFEAETFVTDKGPYGEWTLSPDTPLYVAGRSFIFSDLELLKSCTDFGIVGTLPVQAIDLLADEHADVMEHLNEIEMWMFQNFPESYVHEHYSTITKIMSGRADA